MKIKRILDSKRDIVQYVIENGALLENVFYPERLLDEQGNDFRDFVESDNNFYFGGIKKVLEQVNLNAIKKSDTKIFVEKCYRAVQTWSDLNDLYCALPTEDSDIEEFENFYELAIRYIIACGKYRFKNSDREKNRSDKQQESSIAVQIAECRKFCEANSITVVHEYKDEAKTGTDGNREEFQQMLQDAYSGEFDLVIVHRWDRFARNVELALSAQKQLDKLGIKVISTVENFDDTPEGDFFKLMSMGMAALYSKKLSREAFNGQIENARHCKAHSGVALYGYEVAQKKYRIVPKEAEAIRRMFHLIDEGYTYKETVDTLNAEGYRRRDGRLLSYNITDTLRNRQYIGEYIFNLYKRSPVPAKWRRQQKPEAEVVRIADGMPQIVEKELFERVQKKLDGRMQHNGRGRKKGKYLLTGLMTCGICGSAVTGEKSIARGKAYFAYTCGGKIKHDGRKYINIVYLDKYVVNLFTRIFLSLRNTDKVIALLRQGIAKLYDSHIEKLAALKKQFSEKEKLIANLNEIVSKNKGKALASVIANNIVEEKSEEEKLLMQIDRLKTEKASLPRINKETLKRKATEFKKILDGIDFYLKQETLQTLIAEIRFNKDTVDTIINLHELAGFQMQLTCTVTESIDNIRYPYTLRNMDFDFDGLQIRL